jgi:putative ABC transport system permease protein
VLGAVARPVLRLFRLISYPQLRASWGRTALVVAGIATGVSLIVGINIINRSVLTNFQNTIELIAGPAALEVTLGVGEVGFDEATVDLVRADADVRAAVPLVRGTIAPASNPIETLQLFGVDLTAEDELQRYQVTSDRQAVLRGLADPRSILLTTTFADRYGVGDGQTIALATPQGVADFTVRGLLQTKGVAAAFGGQLAVMDLPAAQLLLGKNGRIDQIDVMLRPDADVETVKGRLASALPPTLTVARPLQRGVQYESILGSFQAMLTGLSLLCLVAGVYIVYNTTSTSAIDRGIVMAGLRLIGADSKRLFRLLMLEALALGLMGAVLGIPVGIAISQLMIGMVADSMGMVFQLRFPVPTLAIDLKQQLLIGGLGVVAALFASYFAARRLTALEPLDVMRADLSSITRPTSSARLVRWWLLLVTISAIALALEVHYKSVGWGNFGSTLWFASSIVIAIPLVRRSASVLSRWMPRLFGAEGRVAAESLFRSPTRTGVTVAAVALVLTVAITAASISLSLQRSISSYFIGGFLASDITVSAIATEGGWLETAIPTAIADEIAQVDGVRATELLRILPGQVYRGERIALAGLSDGLLDPDRYPPGWYRAGDPIRAANALRNGQGANVSASLADRFGLGIGDNVDLDTPSGRLVLPIVGIVPDYMSDRGGIAISIRLLADRWSDRLVNRIMVTLQPGVSFETARAAIQDQLGGRYRLKMLSLPEMVDFHSRAVKRAFALMDAIQLLIVVVTVAGIFDLLVSAIFERRRELAVWRLIGAGERQVRRSVVLESATIGLSGAALGVLLGFVTAGIWVAINFRYLVGYHLEFHFASAATAWFIALVMLMTIVAGYSAAYQATRQSVLDGLRIE